jgi:hypothetical protein
MSHPPFAGPPATALPFATGFFSRQQNTRSMGPVAAPQDDSAPAKTKSRKKIQKLSAFNAFVSSGLPVMPGGIVKKGSAPVNAPAFTFKKGHDQGRELRSGSTRNEPGLPDAASSDMYSTTSARLPPAVSIDPVVSSGLPVMAGGIVQEVSAPVNAPAFTFKKGHGQGRELRSGSTRDEPGLPDAASSDMSAKKSARSPPAVPLDTEEAVHPIPPSLKPDSMPKHAKTKHSVCPHDRRWTLCKDCGGGSLCTHKRQKHLCKECGGKSRCSHGRQRSKCKACAKK